MFSELTQKSTSNENDDGMGFCIKDIIITPVRELKAQGRKPKKCSELCNWGSRDYLQSWLWLANYFANNHEKKNDTNQEKQADHLSLNSTVYLGQIKASEPVPVMRLDDRIACLACCARPPCTLGVHRNLPYVRFEMQLQPRHCWITS